MKFHQRNVVDRYKYFASASSPLLTDSPFPNLAMFSKPSNSKDSDSIDLATCPIMELHNYRRLDEGRSTKLNLSDPIFSEAAVSAQRVYPAKQVTEVDNYLLNR